ncbi:MAG: SEC-C metal-binding domain-containing protein [Rhabdochlamydiaceae bacterium]|nr:SEC-C metal-binding domain-containing protein [Candidatus Amphrikana amoebophyrae]
MEKVGRNDPCPCGSGKKYKKCCGKVGPRKFSAQLLSSNKDAAPLLDRMKGLTSSVMRAVHEVGGEKASSMTSHVISKAAGQISKAAPVKTEAENSEVAESNSEGNQEEKSEEEKSS